MCVWVYLFITDSNISFIMLKNLLRFSFSNSREFCPKESQKYEICHEIGSPMESVKKVLISSKLFKHICLKGWKGFFYYL